ncbi:MAG: hypothetical protein HKP50_17120 [Myxococcales bacterium]|nr:hypothetical protein [Myxococcales bacterium]
MKPKEIDADQMGHVLGLLVHDLRNPAATISANVDFLQEVGLADDDSNDALQDVRLGVGELRRGLDMLHGSAAGSPATCPSRPRMEM